MRFQNPKPSLPEFVVVEQHPLGHEGIKIELPPDFIGVELGCSQC